MFFNKNEKITLDYLERPGRYWHKHELDEQINKIHTLLINQYSEPHLERVFSSSRSDLRHKIIVVAKNRSGNIVGLLSFKEQTKVKDTTLLPDCYYCLPKFSSKSLEKRLHRKIFLNYFFSNGLFKKIKVHSTFGFNHEKINPLSILTIGRNIPKMQLQS